MSQPLPDQRTTEMPTLDDFIGAETGGPHDRAFSLYRLQADAQHILMTADIGGLPSHWVKALRVVAGETLYMCKQAPCEEVVASEGMLCTLHVKAAAGSHVA